MQATSRQKAILVGLRMAAMTDFRQQIPSRSGNAHYRLWVLNELNNLHDPDFEAELLDKFSCTQMPEDYLAKISPLAIATWYVEGQSWFKAPPPQSLPVLDVSHIAKIIDMFRDRWGICMEANHDMPPLSIKPASGSDLINFWLLIKRHLLLQAPQLAFDLDVRHLRNHKLIYLSGGQEFAPDGGINWRAEISPPLFMMGFDIFNPVYEEGVVHDKFGVNLPKLKETDFERYMRCGTTLINHDYPAVVRSDLMIVRWNQAAAQGAGTKAEVTWAEENGIPVLAWLDDGFHEGDMPLWTLGGIRERKNIYYDHDLELLLKRVRIDYA